jgi:outer membrane protein assembly factor BamB
MCRGRIFCLTKEGYTNRILGYIGIIIIITGLLLISPRPPTHAANPGDWSTYMMDNGRSGFNSSETILNPKTASSLRLHWQYHAGGAINTQPIVVNGVIYWGSWDGYEHALDLNGKQLWQTYLGVTTAGNGCSPSSAGVASTATVATVLINRVMTQVVFVGGGDAHFYALDATSGTILWITSVGTSPSSMIWDAPAVYHGSVYIGVSSYGDCPLISGQLVQMDVSTGTIQHSFSTVTSKCQGGGVWGSPTIDEANNAVYISTGNGLCGMSFSLIALSASDLSLISFWRVPRSERVGDSDFGSTPTLFQATINGTVHRLVGLANKNGFYFAFDRANISAGPVWQRQLSTGKDNISSSAWDGATLYAGSMLPPGKGCGGHIRALDPATGNYLWEYCAPGKVIGALTLVPGLVIAGSGVNLVVLKAATGQPLFVYQDRTGGGPLFWGGATVSNGVLYMGNKGGNFYAFGL